MTWDPGLYARSAAPRLRPALELLGRVHHENPRRVHDVGCGRGEIARLMADRWPQAHVIGSDSSPEMLTEARSVPSRVRWLLEDVREWRPSAPVDVIYANALLHWVEDHASVLPRLVGDLAPGGVFAAQMPLSWAEPSHRLLRKTLGEGGYGTAALRRHYGRRPVGEPETYYDLLAPHVAELDIWTTRYLHVLDGEDAVLEWVKGSALRPALEALTAHEAEQFMDEYGSRLRAAYPSRAGGQVVFGFPRLFIVATR